MSSAHIGLYCQPTIVLFYLSLCPGEVCYYIRRPIIDGLLYYIIIIKELYI